MATNRDLLKEAIADAKAVKEMAIANAKAALEEAFTPQLQSMLSAKLQEMEDLDEEDLNEEDLDEAGFGPMSGVKGHGNIEDDSSNSVYENEDEDMDLDELLKELNEDIEDVEDYEDEDADGIEDENDEDSGEPLDLEDMTDEDLKKMIEDVIADMMKSGELEVEEEEEEEGEEEEGEEEEEEEINLDELLAEIEEMDEEMEDEGMMYEEEEEMYENTNISELEAELAEAYSTIESLRSDLNEVNLLNAKLLYSNKIFKSKNLTESQKVTVLSSFDKAKSVGEVKLVFETLSEGLKTKTNAIKENLGSASKMTSAPKTKQPIVESNDMVARFQKLAGII
jgi:hypothetical protein